MRIDQTTIILPEGAFSARVKKYGAEDKVALQEIYSSWRSLCDKLKSIDARQINLPDGLSEICVCLAMGFVQVIKSKAIKGNKSFDAYCEKTKKRIQIKGCSILPDLTSFGPKSVWDELYFADFHRKGEWDGAFDVYLIPNELIYSQVVCGTQTVRDQQEMGRRPRFSIYTSIILENEILPAFSGSVF